MQIRRFLSLPLHHIDTSVILETERTADIAGDTCNWLDTNIEV